MVTSRANADDGDKAVDEGSPSKPQPKAKAGAKKKPQPKAKAGAKKTEFLKGPIAKKKTSPKGSYVSQLLLSVSLSVRFFSNFN